MTRSLLDTLYGEEALLLEELRSSALFRRYEAVRRLLDLYGAPAPIGADLDDLLNAPSPAPAAAPARPPGNGTRLILESIASDMRSEVA